MLFGEHQHYKTVNNCSYSMFVTLNRLESEVHCAHGMSRSTMYVPCPHYVKTSRRRSECVDLERKIRITRWSPRFLALPCCATSSKDEEPHQTEGRQRGKGEGQISGTAHTPGAKKRKRSGLWETLRLPRLRLLHRIVNWDWLWA